MPLLQRGKRICRVLWLGALCGALAGVTSFSAAAPTVVARAGYAIEMLATGLKSPTGIVWDPEGDLFVSETGDGRVVRITSEGQTLPLLTGIFSGVDEFHPSGPFGLAFDAQQQLYVAVGEQGFDPDRLSDSSQSRTVLKIRTTSKDKASSSIADRVAQTYTGFINPFGLAFNPSERNAFYVSDGAANQIWRVDAAGKANIFVTLDRVLVPTLGPLARVDAVPTGITFDQAGNLYVSEFTGLPFPSDFGRVLKISIAAQGIAFVRTFVRGLTTPVALAFDPDGTLFIVEHGTFLAADPPFQTGSGRVLKFNPARNTLQEVVVGLTQPAGIAFDPDGNFYVTEMTTGKVFKVSKADSMGDI